MSDKPLSPREEQILDLAIEGLTNEQIAQQLELSISSVNTYWLRIRLKSREDSKTMIVSRFRREKNAEAIRDANAKDDALARLKEEHLGVVLELQAALALLQLALDQLRSAVWATDQELCVTILAKGKSRKHTATCLGKLGRACTLSLAPKMTLIRRSKPILRR